MSTSSAPLLSPSQDNHFPLFFACLRALNTDIPQDLALFPEFFHTLHFLPYKLMNLVIAYTSKSMSLQFQTISNVSSTLYISSFLLGIYARTSQYRYI